MMSTGTPECVLALCCSGGAPSVALALAGVVRSVRLDGEGNEGNEALLAAVADLFDGAEPPRRTADLIVYAAGPGSFTGLRVGVAMAQALGFAWDAPLVPVSSLAITALGALRAHVADQTSEDDPSVTDILVAEDARMGDVYIGRYRGERGVLRSLEPDVITPAQDFRTDGAAIDVVVGRGIGLLPASLRSMLPEPCEPDAEIEAELALALGLTGWHAGASEPAAAARPRYLRTDMGYERLTSR